MNKIIKVTGRLKKLSSNSSTQKVFLSLKPASKSDSCKGRKMFKTLSQLYCYEKDG